MPETDAQPGSADLSIEVYTTPGRLSTVAQRHFGHARGRRSGTRRLRIRGQIAAACPFRPEMYSARFGPPGEQDHRRALC